MESNQTVSDQKSGSDRTQSSVLSENAFADTQDSPAPLKGVKQQISYIIPDEILRALIDQRPPRSRFQAISNNPLIVGLLGVLVGGLLAAYYNYQQKLLEYKLGAQQQELTHLLSFSNELNKLRIEKVSEVWERLDQDEFIIDSLLEDSRTDRSNKSSNASGNDKRAAQITKLIDDDQAMVAKYRFWLGDELSKTALTYLDSNIKYSLNELGAPANNSNPFSEARKNARQDIDQVRKLFLRGELRE